MWVSFKRPVLCNLVAFISAVLAYFTSTKYVALQVTRVKYLKWTLDALTSDVFFLILYPSDRYVGIAWDILFAFPNHQ